MSDAHDTKTESERVIQRAILLDLGSEPDFLLLRNQVGQAIYHDGVKEFRVPYGLGKGSPDLVGILRPWGRFVCFEVKTHDGAVSAEQLKCHHVWRTFGAHVAVVRSVEDARFALNEARRWKPAGSIAPAAVSSKRGRR